MDSSSAKLIIERPGDDTRAVFDVGAGASQGGAGGISLEQRRAPPPARQPSAARPPPARVIPRASLGVTRSPVAAAAPQQRFDDDDLETYAEFANPNKMRPPAKQYPPRGGGGGGGGSDDGSLRGGSEGSEGEGDDPEGSEGDDGEGSEYDGDGGGGGAMAVEPEPEEILRPSEGYRTLDEEKADILFKLSRLRKQGVRGFREFTTYSDIRDMRTELAKVRTELEVERSIKFQRKILMGIVSALEFGNKRWDPFDLQLDGWSETVHEGVDEYDGVFEELYFKYRGKISTPPEIRLILMIGGSAMMFHMQNAMFKNMLPNMGEAMRNNPDMMANMMKSMQQQMQPTAASGPPPQQQQQQQPNDEPAQQQPGVRREMRGPGMDVGKLLGGGGGGGPLGGLGGLGGGLGGLGGLFGNGMTGNMPLPPLELPSMIPVGTMPPPAGSRGRDARAPVQQQRQQPQQQPMAMAEEDRFSDVISEDLQSVPDDLQSIASEQPEQQTRSVVIQPKKRRAAAGPSSGSRKSKKVIVI